ncbi:hypothetical protein [Amycolatopsis lexingtonensis]|uniref:hypothetical protein n=1 Tax=Amycolatopsis lexingtonensis TaxID=218822 RepID=UPI003F6FBC16
MAGAIVSVDVPDLRGVLVTWQENAVLTDLGQEAWVDDPTAKAPSAPSSHDCCPRSTRR